MSSIYFGFLLISITRLMMSSKAYSIFTLVQKSLRALTKLERFDSYVYAKSETFIFDLNFRCKTRINP